MLERILPHMHECCESIGISTDVRLIREYNQRNVRNAVRIRKTNDFIQATRLDTQSRKKVCK